MLFLFIQRFESLRRYFISLYVTDETEGATMNPMSNVRGREVPDEAPRVPEGSQSRRRHGELDRGNEGEGLDTSS